MSAADTALGAYRMSLLTCATCHDQCLAATPELVATGDQALAVSRIAGMLLRLDAGHDAWSSDPARALFHGLDDGSQREVCIFAEAGQRIEPYLRAGRGEAVRRGLAPDAVAEIAGRVATTGDPFGLGERLPHATAPAEHDGPLLVHDAASRLDQDDVEAACIRLLAAVGSVPGVVRIASCGAIERWLGLDALARESARTALERVAGQGTGPIVTSDPVLAQALQEASSTLGLSGHRSVVHISAYLAERADRLPEFSPAPIRVTYHDPGALARGLGVTEPPRYLLRSVPGLELAEPQAWGRAATSDGPLMDLGLSGTPAIAARRTSELLATGASAIVTSSPYARANLRKTAVRVPVHDLALFLDGLLGAAGVA